MLAPPPPEARNAAGLTVTDTEVSMVCLCHMHALPDQEVQSKVRGRIGSFRTKPKALGPSCPWRRPVRHNYMPGTQFESSQPHHAVHCLWRFPDAWRKSPIWRGWARALCLCKALLGFQGAFRGCGLWPWKSRFPAMETGAGRDRFESVTHCGVRPRIWCCRGHSGGKSARRATPMP